jgi:hypothetical protein
MPKTPSNFGPAANRLNVYDFNTEMGKKSKILIENTPTPFLMRKFEIIKQKKENNNENHSDKEENNDKTIETDFSKKKKNDGKKKHLRIIPNTPNQMNNTKRLKKLLNVNNYLNEEDEELPGEEVSSQQANNNYKKNFSGYFTNNKKNISLNNKKNAIKVSHIFYPKTVVDKINTNNLSTISGLEVAGGCDLSYGKYLNISSVKLRFLT